MPLRLVAVLLLLNRKEKVVLVHRYWRMGMILEAAGCKRVHMHEAKPALVAQIFIGLFEAPVAGVTYRRYHAEPHHCLSMLLIFTGLFVIELSVSGRGHDRAVHLHVACHEGRDKIISIEVYGARTPSTA